jgi:hypothetical protein
VRLPFIGISFRLWKWWRGSYEHYIMSSVVLESYSISVNPTYRIGKA